MRPQGLFLDWDGTLADSLPVLRRAYDAFLEERGRQGSREEFELLNGVPLAAILVHLRRGHALEEPLAALEKRYRELLDAAYREVAPAAGAAELLGAARERGIAVAVVTSAPQRFTERWLERHTLGVAVVVGGDRVARGKPHPDPYLRALAETGCAAPRSLAVEDSVLGARSATEAGIPTCVLGSPSAADWPPAVRGFLSGLADLLPMLEARDV